MTAPTVNRYKFFDIFYTISGTAYLAPNFNVNINGTTFQKGIPVPQGPVFGGLNLYNYAGKDIAGIWDNNTKVLNIVGFY